MASSSTQLGDIEERFFECSFCLQTLKEPKILHCLHRYCRECLKKIIAEKEDAFNCPLCDGKCDVPPDGVDGFKTDFFIKSVLEFCQLENTYKEDNVKRCRGCKEVKNVICYCFKCRDFLCQQCYQFHLDNDMVEEHRPHLLDLQTVDVRSLTLEKLTSLTEDPRCAVHVKRPAEMCCETCGNTPICVACVFGDHKGHMTHEVRNLAKSEGEKMKAMMTVLDKCKDKLYELPKRVAKVRRALGTNVKKQLENARSKHMAATEKVLEKAEVEKRVLEKQRNAIIMRNKEECKQVRKEMEEEMKKLKKKYDEILQGKEQSCGREVVKVDRQTGIVDDKSSAKVEKYNRELQGYEEKVRASKVDNEERISEVADHVTHTINRYENLNATAQTVQASHNEWTEAQCLPAITAAGEVLIEEARKEYSDLESLSETSVRESAMFIEQKVEFTVNPPTASSSSDKPPSSDKPSTDRAMTRQSTPKEETRIENFQRDLILEFQRETVDINAVFKFIESTIQPPTRKTKEFIRALVSAVCFGAVKGEGTNSRGDHELLKKRSVLMQRYIDGNPQLELQALYAVQHLNYSLENPPGLLRLYFDVLYDEDVISEETFYAWRDSKEPTENTGKGIALKSVTSFYTWLEESDPPN